MRKPFYKKSHKCWYYRDQSNKETRLDPDEQKAIRLWQRLTHSYHLDDYSTFDVLAEAWLNEHKPLLSAAAWAQTTRYIANFLSVHKHTPCNQITKGKMVEWLNAPKPRRLRKDGTRGPDVIWSKASRKDAAHAIKRIFKWAFDMGKISRNQLAGIRLPDAQPRCVLIRPDDHERMVKALRQREDGKTFALYLIASKCGCRPRQLREVRLRNVAPDHNAWVFDADEHKSGAKTGKKLIVNLSPCVATITKIVTHKIHNADSHLFVNCDGRPFTKDGVGRRLKRMRERMGISGDYIPYAYRHTYATEALLAGVPVATVSALLGHSDTRMVSRVYGHLDQHQGHLQQAAAQAASRRYS